MMTSATASTTDADVAAGDSEDDDDHEVVIAAAVGLELRASRFGVLRKGGERADRCASRHELVADEGPLTFGKHNAH